jgi:hypothetical protein
MKPSSVLNLIAILATGILGCGGNSTGTVTGTVTFEGQPIEQGQITFSPAGTEGSTAGDKIANGKYTVKDLKPAKYHVVVEATKEPKFTSPGDPANNRTKTAEEIRAQYDPLPLDTKGKEQDLEVKGGEQVLDFKLTSPSKSK